MSYLTVTKASQMKSEYMLLLRRTDFLFKKQVKFETLDPSNITAMIGSSITSNRCKIMLNRQSACDWLSLERQFAVTKLCIIHQ
jgi:hypothetical protein